MGANGAGKRTLLKLAIGELTPRSGRVWRLATAVYAPQRTDNPPAGGERFLAAGDAVAGDLRRRLGVADNWLERWPTLSHGERDDEYAMPRSACAGQRSVAAKRGIAKRRASRPRNAARRPRTTTMGAPSGNSRA